MTDILLKIGAEFDGADKVNEQLNKLDRSLDENIKAVNRFDQEVKRLNRAKKNQTVTEKGYQSALQQSVARLLDTSSATERQTQAKDRNAEATERARQATARANTTQQAARTQFLATANSIAVLDGPLGGVASRFSAFGVLIGRIGIPLAALSVGFTTFSVAATRALRSFGEFEVQMVTLENAFDNVNNKIGMSAAQISNFSEQIALNSLESADSVRRAAIQLVGFGDLTQEIFKDVLEASADLSAAGFGSLETNATRLARAIQDPVRSLRDLRTVGITFSAAQENLIRTLVETGRRGEAAAIIMERVNETFGGAAQRQAETFAGKIDTIRQGYVIFFREIGQFLEESGVGRMFDAIASAVESYVASNTVSLEDLKEQQKTLKAVLENERRLLAQHEAAMAEQEPERTRRGGTLTSQTRRIIRELEEELAQVEAAIERLGGAPTQVADENLNRLEDALSNVNNEISELVRTAGMTDMQRFVDEILRATETTDGLSEEVDNLREELSRAAEIKFNLQQASSLEDSLRRSTETLRESQFLAQAQLEFVGQTGGEVQTLINLRADELRVQDTINQLQQDLKGATGDTANAIRTKINSLNSVLSLLQAAAQAAGLMAGEIDRATANANALASAVSSVQGALSGARASIAGMNAEIAALEGGMSVAAAAGMGNIARQAAQIREQISEITDPVKYAQALAQVRQLESQGAEYAQTLADAQERADALRQATRGGGGGGGGSAGGAGGGAGQSAMQSLMEEIDLQRQRIGLTEEELRLFEARLKVTNAARQDGISLGQEEIDRIAQMIVENEKLIEQQQRLERARERAAQRMTDLFMAATQGGDAFKRTLANIIQELARMAAMRAFQSIVGGSGGGGGFLSFFFNEKGNIFQGGSVKAFAKGGVVDGPTMFPIRGAQTGLMGEAGPEAIIPLKRARDGSLGVQGGVTNAVSVTYAPQISVKGSGEEVSELRQEIAKMNAEAPARIISTIQKAQKKRVL